MFAQDSGGPLPEARTLNGLDAIPDRDDDVEVVEGDRFVRTSNVQILHIAFLRKFAVCKHVAYVLGHHRTLASEQIRHLRLSQPNRVAIKLHVQPDLTAGRLIKNNFRAPALCSRQQLHAGALARGDSAFAVRLSLNHLPPFMNSRDANRKERSLRLFQARPACRARCCMHRWTARRWRFSAGAALRCTAFGPAIWGWRRMR